MLCKRRSRWEIGGFFFVCGAGVLLHFAYDWSGGNALVGIVSAVNESTWEHMKLLFVSMTLLTVVQFALEERQSPDFWAVRAVSVLAGLVLIPVLFYTYTGILGRNVAWVNIAIYFAAVLGAFAVDHRLRQQGALHGAWKQMAGLAVLWLLAFVFLWCTWQPVKLPLWQDPVTGTYGIR